MLPRDTKLFCQGEGQGDLPAEDLDAILSKSSRMAPPSGLTNKVNGKLGVGLDTVPLMLLVANLANTK